MPERCDDLELLRSYLDDLAARVAEALERGDEAAAWDMTAALQRVVDPETDIEPRPSWPVIGRRYAQVHRRVLLAARGSPDRARVAVLVVVSGGAADPPSIDASPRTSELAHPRC